ncbi:hypothetical protein WAI453_007517 [Rhynchosporium graminicola]|uniref:RRM domain-containing protein n=1 Tax=Rhynchosporium graminicola TaxID=2792576 RepID=A0A1E1LN67_9HELO|nr:uncharacterized protein RCO7_11392 [Rhynchosporium commune]
MTFQNPSAKEPSPAHLTDDKPLTSEDHPRNPKSRHDLNRFKKLATNTTDNQSFIDSSSRNLMPNNLSSSDTSQNSNEPAKFQIQRQVNTDDSGGRAYLGYTEVRCGNLRPWVTAEELKKHFAPCAGLKDAHIPLETNGDVKNYGVATFYNTQDARVALESLNGTLLRGIALKLTPARPISLAEIKFSMSTNPVGMSESNQDMVANSFLRAKLVKRMRIIAGKDRPLKRQITKERWESRQQPRLQILADLIGGDNAHESAKNLDVIIDGIDETYYHESELSRNLRIWDMQFDFFDKIAAWILKEREAFRDKEMFKPSPDHEDTTIRDRIVLFDQDCRQTVYPLNITISLIS